MYLTNTTEEVRKILDELETMEDINKMKFVLYTFGELNNNQINSNNESNPNIKDNDDITIFNFDLLGFEPNYCTFFLQYNVMLFNAWNNNKNVIEDNGNVIGIEYDASDIKLNSLFDKLTYNEKIDVMSELVIRYDNETLFKKLKTMLTFIDEKDGYEIAREMQEYKIN